MNTSGKLRRKSEAEGWIWQKSLVFLLFLVLPTASFAQLNSSQQERIKNFLDGFVKERVQQGHLTGASAVLLYKDSILLKEGYGWAEFETRRPFDPDSTLFRLCSVTKTFTATAIMQLQEEGLLTIDDPINQYLGIPLPSSFSEPITIKHLLTHSAGFGERYINMASPLHERQMNLSEVLNKYPAKIERMPGMVFSYSNYGFGLLGKIIENVSGKAYEEYIKENVLEKVGRHSTLIGMPEDKQDIAIPYRPKEGGFLPLTPDHINLSPAGGMLSTAADMALYLSAHLNRRILLEEESFQLMQQRQFSNHPAVDGFGLSLFEKNKEGVVAFSHGGGWRGYNTYLLMIPALKIGYFVASNTENSAMFVDPLAKEFMGFVSRQFHEGPKITNKTVVKEEAALSLAGLEGNYRFIRSPSGGLATLFFELLILEEKKVKVNGKAALVDGEKFIPSTEGVLLSENNRENAYALQVNMNHPEFCSDA